MDDRRYLCECIVVTTNLKNTIDQIQLPTDNNHEIVYIIKSSFFKNHIQEMRLSAKNKFFICDFLVEIKFNKINKTKTIRYFKNIKIEVTSRAPNHLSAQFIPDNTYILCASFGIITTHPQVQLGITEGAFKSELIYKNTNEIPCKPQNNTWKFNTSTRGVIEELGINKPLFWTCINESLFKWNKSVWVATLLTYI